MMKKPKGNIMQNYLNYPRVRPLSNLLSILLLPFSWLYGSVMILRRSFYRNELFKSTRLKHPVISVGNLTTGGTGKTPFEIYLIDICKEMGLKPLLLSHGYGKSPAEPGFVRGTDMDKTSGLPDEIAMLAGMFPDLAIAFDKNRIDAYKLACDKSDFDLIILDDGFQHLKIRRDLDILIADANRPFGSGRLLPSGNLREPKSAAESAQMLVLNQKGGLKTKTEAIGRFTSLMILEGGYEITETVNLLSGEEHELSQEADQYYGAITAIGDADSFADIIKSTGIEISHTFQFRDHHDYSPADLELVRDECRKLKIERLFTTEKDAVKLRKICFEKPEIYVIKVAFRLSDGVDILKQKIGELTQDVKRS
jgi:tetraacyldisaccharide 4'-kinase